LLPTYAPDPDVLMTQPMLIICSIKNGHIIARPEERPWIIHGASRVYPDFKIDVADEYEDIVWYAPDMPQELAYP